MRYQSAKVSAGFLNLRLVIYSLMALLLIGACKQKSTEQDADVFQLLKASAAEINLTSGQLITDVPVNAVFQLEFSSSADTQSARNYIKIVESDEDDEASLNFNFGNEAKQISAEPEQELEWNTAYRLEISEELQSAQGAAFPGIEYSFQTEKGDTELLSATVNEVDLTSSNDVRDIAYDEIHLQFTFSEALDENDYLSYFNISPDFSSEISLSEDEKTVTITNTQPLDYYRHYSVTISNNLEAANDISFGGFEAEFQTGLNPENKFQEISDEELLDKIQETTFQYFWDFAHPVSGLARERNTSGETVTIGGSGFGLKAIITGIHRGYITRTEGVERFQKIVDFLESADRFHGVWPHWLNGSTGKTQAFSTYDDGGDLVETAFMAQGLITVRQFLDENNSEEAALIEDINHLLDTIEWDWYSRGGKDVLYWHWSSNHEWRMNMQINGYNEALIVYILAASSDDYSIDPVVYHQGWASSGDIQNGNSFYGYTLPLGFDYGGPLFFAHYSFLGLDPRNLSDTYANYWEQNRTHTLINREHSIVNPNNFVGYSSNSWGITASDEPGGYSAHDPNNDNGTITPTAAISSIPYTPEESMDAIHHFYYVLGDKLWGEYGFYDAFNPTESWWADSFLAIDQGPIIIMIENHRSGLLWDLFMTAPEVQDALDQLGFTTSKK